MEEETTKRKPGRPVGSVRSSYVGARSVRFRPEDQADLEWLAQHWRASEAETIRRALRETAQRERRKRPEP